MHYRTIISNLQAFSCNGHDAPGEALPDNREKRPGTDEVVHTPAEQGKKALLMVPVSFVSDHIETLYEIDMLYKEQALARGIVEYRRTESLNTDPAFISVLAEMVTERLEILCSH